MLNNQEAFKVILDGLIKRKENVQKKLDALIKERGENAKRIKELEEYNLNAQCKVQEIYEKIKSLAQELALKQNQFDNHPSVKKALQDDAYQDPWRRRDPKVIKDYYMKTLPEGTALEEAMKALILGRQELNDSKLPGEIRQNLITVEQLKLQKPHLDIKIELLELEIEGLDIQIKEITPPEPKESKSNVVNAGPSIPQADNPEALLAQYKRHIEEQEEQIRSLREELRLQKEIAQRKDGPPGGMKI